MFQSLTRDSNHSNSVFDGSSRSTKKVSIPHAG